MKLSEHAVQGASSETTIPSRGNQLSIVYYNARSLVPKFDELCASIETYKPDIVCIVETWLSKDISDNELGIPGFTLHRKDRHRHGGGVLIYTAESLIVSLLPSSMFDQSLEFLPISVTFFNQKFCIAVFYRPPDSPSSIFDTVFHSLELIDIAQYSNFIFVGDFNVDFYNHSHPLYSK